MCICPILYWDKDLEYFTLALFESHCQVDNADFSRTQMITDNPRHSYISKSVISLFMCLPSVYVQFKMSKLPPQKKPKKHHKWTIFMVT